MLRTVTKVKAKRKEMRDGGVHDVQIPVKDNEGNLVVGPVKGQNTC